MEVLDGYTDDAAFDSAPHKACFGQCRRVICALVSGFRVVLRLFIIEVISK